MEGENPTAATDATGATPATDVSREAQVMATPPRDIVADAATLTDAGGGRVITPENQKELNAAAPGSAAAAESVVNTRQFAVIGVAPNEFKITHGGKDLGGKVLTPTEVPIVLGWLNSLPPE